MFFLRRTISDDILRKFLPFPNGMVMKQLVSPIDEIYVNILYNSVIEYRNLWMKYIGSLLPFNRYVNFMN